jgi:hypothetical protein
MAYLVSFYTVTVRFFLTQGLILYFIFRNRRKSGRSAVYATGDTLEPTRLGARVDHHRVVLDMRIDIRGADV